MIIYREKKIIRSKYKCECRYIYNAEVGDIRSGVVAGTPFAELSDNWAYPECGASQDRFDSIEQERIQIDEQEGEETPSVSPDRRTVYTSGVEQRSIGELEELYRDGDLDIQSYFQRGPVWDGGKRSRLIESVFLDVPISMFYFVETTEELLELNKQSSDLSGNSFDQSRKAFLVNLVSETITHGITMKIDGKASDWMVSYIRGVHEAIKDVDVELAGKSKKAWRLWAEGQWIEITQMRPYILKAFEEEKGGANER